MNYLKTYDWMLLSVLVLFVEAPLGGPIYHIVRETLVVIVRKVVTVNAYPQCM